MAAGCIAHYPADCRVNRCLFTWQLGKLASVVSLIHPASVHNKPYSLSRKVNSLGFFFFLLGSLWSFLVQHHFVTVHRLMKHYCSRNICDTELQIRRAIEDNSKIFFLISQTKTYVIIPHWNRISLKGRICSS